MNKQVEQIRAEIERQKDVFRPSIASINGNSAKVVLQDLLNFIDDMEEEDQQPEYSCFETIYKRGKKTHWNIGDTLAFYESYSDKEGECVLGKVTRVELEEEEDDWFYTFEDGNVYDEQSLLEDKTYKKN